MSKEKTQATRVPEYVRSPAVAGQFYESNPEELRKIINKYLSLAGEVEIPGTLIGLMEPHAGYVYSGPVAAYGYKQVIGKKYKTVIILAPSHRARFTGVSVLPSGYYRTPLGDVQVDEEMAKKIISLDPDRFRYHRQADEYEHSLEVQVPFLQVVLGNDWKIVPIVYGDADIRTCAMVAQALAPNFDPSAHLIVASSDMSHYHPYNTAVEMDKKALDFIVKLQLRELAEVLDSSQCELCGTGPVITLMILTEAYNGEAKLLKYANSGDTAGSKDQVVGYGCVAFYTEKMPERHVEEAGKDQVQFTVSEEQKKMLLSMARKTLEEKIKHNKMPDFSAIKDPILDMRLGLFVTLRKEPNNMLRGCIGHCFPVNELKVDLPELTVSSALNDHRFSPVRADELDKIKIEISLLSPMRKISDWHEIQIPGHGVYVKRGYRSGVFLPSVAEETGWDRETFMSYLCVEKAGLSADAWKEPDTELYVFTAVKFGEE